jgi:hypothetical protein
MGPLHKQEQGVADTAERHKLAALVDIAAPAASRLGDMTPGMPPVEAALGTTAFAELQGEAEASPEPLDSHTRQAEPPVEPLAVVLEANLAPHRDLCIRPAGGPRVEAALAERGAGARRRAAQEPPAGAVAGTAS